MSCCCCFGKDDASYQDAVTRPSVNTHDINKMERGYEETDSRASDRHAVKVWRSRSSEQNSPASPNGNNGDGEGHAVQLSPHELQAWQDKGGSSRTAAKSGMATLDSIEVDELSTVRGTRQLDHSTPPRTPGRASPPGSSPSSRMLRSAGPVDVDELTELDNIVMALSSKDSSSLNSESHNTPNASPKQNSQRRMSPTSASYARRLSPSGRDINTSSRRRSPSPRSSPRRSSHDKGEAKPPRRPSPTSDQPQIFPDSLSNVPSNVDAETRDRYLMACRILKATLIERETALLPQEKVFLQGLLNETEENKAPSEAQVSAIETASATLLSDPLFHVDSVHSSSFPADGISGKALDSIKAAWHQKAEKRRANNLQMMSQNRPMMTESPMNTSGLSDDTPQIQNVRKYSPQYQASSPSRSSLLDTDDTSSIPASSTTQRAIPSRDKDDYPFEILGIDGMRPGVLTPPLMEALRGFFPYDVAEDNFLLKFSLKRDGSKLSNLLSKVRTSVHTIIAVETEDGHVFGAFCSTPWRVQPGWFGSGDTFLWRLKNSRLEQQGSPQRNFDFDNEMEIFPYTGSDDRIQYCTRQTMAVGGGDWIEQPCPYNGEPKGIGFMVDGDLQGGETNSCSTFANPRLCGRSSRSNEFDIVNLEIWTVTPCHTEAEAELQEMRQLFVMEEKSSKK